MSFGDAAIRYARAGVPVFPLVPGRKVPLTAQGVYAATTDVHQVTEWWARTPAANIGMPTGEISGWDVLDVDVPDKHSEGGRQRRNGWDAVEPALKAGTLLEPVMRVRTPSGGAHLYYAYLPGARNGSLSDYGLDYRAEGGYVVVPPSRTAAGAYQIIQQPNLARRRNRCDFATFREVLQQEQDAGRPNDPPLEEIMVKTPSASAARRMEALAHRVATANLGNRNNLLYWAARVVVEENLGGLGDLFKAAQVAGLTAEESSRTIQSAVRGPKTERLSIAPKPQAPAANGPAPF